MSLTSFLKCKDVREKFSIEFPHQKFKVESQPSLPLTTHYGLVGTAFDYLLRFYMSHLNENALCFPWVAEYVLNELESEFLAPPETPKEYEERQKKIKTIETIIDQAAWRLQAFLKTGKLKDDLIRSSLLLAQIDPIYRAGYWDPNLGTVDDQDIQDLRNLISLIDPEIFRAQVCILNPTFGEGSRLVGGADVDLVLDDVMIDVKTTKNPSFKKEYLHQLIGYYTLYKIGGITGLGQEHEIKRLGIYFSRYGYFHAIQVCDLISDRFPKFLQWFVERAEAEKEVLRKQRLDRIQENLATGYKTREIAF
jgi:hypothetical protein